MDLDPVPQPPEPKRRCFCCGKKYGTRQLARHLKAFIKRLNEQLDTVQAARNADNLDDDGDDDDAGLGGAEMDIDDAALGVGADAIPDFGEGEYAFGIGGRVLIISHP
ncbi:hypothetical protein FS749_005857 [Ceratobasidium sp. UAMH 11750]|nr:hypothetical protein FS749_005857 [Ceratobasidium sp. UAMH 11750]